GGWRTLVTMPRTVTNGSLVVVTTSGVTWSTRTWTNGVALGSPAAARGAAVGTVNKARMPATTGRQDAAARESRGAITVPDRGRSCGAVWMGRNAGGGCASASVAVATASWAATAAAPTGRRFAA